MPVLQTGVAPEHWLFARHCTHAGTGVSQIGVAPLQTPMFVAEQTPHAPDAWQAGALPGHCASDAHAWQVCVPVLQIGVVPEQFVSDRQATQTRGDTLPRQSGVAAAAVAGLRALLDEHVWSPATPAVAPLPSVG